jgi:SAM-dependent methyltransferase
LSFFVDFYLILNFPPLNPNLITPPCTHRSERFLPHLRAVAARQPQVEVVHGDATEAMTTVAASGSVDLIYIRWVLSWMSPADRALVLDGCARLLRPGGRVVISDYACEGTFGMHPRTPVFDRVAKVIMADWRSKGGSPDAGSHVPAELLAAGGGSAFAIDTVTSNCPVARANAPLWQWPTGFFSTHLEHLCAQGKLEAAEVAEFLEMWAGVTGSADGWYMAPLQFDIVASRRAAEH